MLYPLSYGRGWSCQKGVRRARVPHVIQVLILDRQLGGEGSAPALIRILCAFLLTFAMHKARHDTASGTFFMSFTPSGASMSLA